MAYRTAPLPASGLLSPYVPPSVIVTQFQAGHGFTTQSADPSSNLNDTSNFVTGTQAATLVTAGAGATTYLLNKGLPAVNMTNRQFAVVIECDSLAHIASSGPLQFLAGSGASTSTTYQWQLTTSGTIDQNLMQAGLWIYCTLNFADATVNGSPAKTALTDFYIRLSDDNTGNKVTVRVNAIYAIPDSGGSGPSGPLGYPSGVASVCFDDGFSSQLANGKPVLDGYGYTPSTYVIWDQVGQAGRLTAAQYLEAQDISGWDVNAHSLTDADHTAGFDNITAAELETNVAAQQAIMAANGFQGKGSAYPKGQLTPAVRAMLRKYFTYVRGTYSKTLETWPPADIFNLRAVSAISPLSGGYAPSLISQGGGLIDQAVTNRRWLILTFHKIIGNVTACVNTTGTTYRVTYSDTSPPYGTGASLTLQGFTPSGLNGTYTVTNSGTAGGFGWAEVTIPANPGNASIQGTALSATTDCDLASYTAIIAKLNSSGIPVRTVAAVLAGMAATSLTAGDASMSVGGTPSAPTVETGTLDQIATLHPPAASWSNNSFKITSLANGSLAQDAAAFGQIPVLSTSAPLADATTPQAGSAATVPKQDHQHPRSYWNPSDQNLIAWTYDPVIASSSTVLATAGTVYCIKLHLPTAQSITNIIMQLTTIGSGLTSGQCFLALYQGAGGALLGVTADQSAIWAGTTGTKTAAISGGPVVAAAGDLMVVAWFNGTTGPTFSRGAGNSNINAGLTVANSRYGTANTGITTTPPSPLGTITSALSVAYWAALS